MDAELMMVIVLVAGFGYVIATGLIARINAFLN